MYELARELDVHSKDILQLLLEKMNIELNNHMSTINDQVAAKVRRLIAVERGEVPPETATSKAVRSAVSPARAHDRGPARAGSGSRSGPVPAGRSGPPTPMYGGSRPGAPVPGRGGGGPQRAPAAAQAGTPGTIAPRPAPFRGAPAAQAGAPAARGPAPAVHGPAVSAPRTTPAAPRAPLTTAPHAPAAALPGGAAQASPGAGRPAPAAPATPAVRGPAAPVPHAKPGAPAGRGPAVPGGPGTRGPAPGTRGPGMASRGPAPAARPAAPRSGPARPGGAGTQRVADLRSRRDRARAILSQREAARAAVRATPLVLTGPITVGDLAQRLSVAPGELVRRLFAMGVMAAINQQLDLERATAVAQELGVEVSSEAAPSGTDLRGHLAAAIAADDPELQTRRPPVVTVLGHVDHGKTTLLDAIRETRVAEGEAGGITQHIGASTVEYQGRRMVFLDTPGHEAFTAMRARGAMVTDIAVLVVAADDGVMPQTVEAADHVKAAGVPVVVALNKVDRPDANPDHALQQLADIGLVPESWGGDTIVVPVSALRRQGLDELMEMLLLVADVEELKADPTRDAVGTVIEARLDRGRGPVATVLVQTGTLRRGDAFVCGLVSGRVRAMRDDRGQDAREAGPATPVEVIGFSDVPEAGDLFEVLSNERTARDTGQRRAEERRRDSLQNNATARAVTLKEFYDRARDGAAEDLKVIVKADVQGSLEALRTSLEKVQNDEVRTVVIHGAAGPVSESDVMLAAASGAVILGFNVRPDGSAEREAERQHVEIRTYRVIYELLDDVRQALAGKLAPKIEEVGVGRAEVRQTFRVPNVGVVAGCYVQDGVVRRNLPARIVRDGTVVYEGSVSSLKRFKEDAREVAAGYECGIGIERFNDVKEGDLIEVYEQREVART